MIGVIERVEVRNDCSRKLTIRPPAGLRVSMVTVTLWVFGSASREKPKRSVTSTAEPLSGEGRVLREIKIGGVGFVGTRLGRGVSVSCDAFDGRVRCPLCIGDAVNASARETRDMDAEEAPEEGEAGQARGGGERCKVDAEAREVRRRVGW